MSDPRLVDVVAMMAMHALIDKDQFRSAQQLAIDSYDIAHQMIKESKRREDDGQPLPNRPRKKSGVHLAALESLRQGQGRADLLGGVPQEPQGDPHEASP